MLVDMVTQDKYLAACVAPREEPQSRRHPHIFFDSLVQ